MNSATLPVASVTRPRAVWIIWICTLVTLVIALAIPIAYFTYRNRLAPEFLEGADRLGALWWANLGMTTILGLASGWTLFRMRTSAVRWFGASLGYAAIASAFFVHIAGPKARATPSHWLTGIATDSLEVLLFAYALHLRAEGKLRGPMPPSAELRALPPLVLAGVAGASAAVGGIVGIAGTEPLIMMTTLPRAASSLPHQAMLYSSVRARH